MKSSASAGFHPTLLEKLCALRAVQPFERLELDELTLVAEIAKPHAYAPGETVHSGGERLSRVLIVVSGAIRKGENELAERLLGPDSLVRNTPVPLLTADPAFGARVLRLDRGPFFTLLRECPAFTIGLLELGAARRSPL